MYAVNCNTTPLQEQQIQMSPSGSELSAINESSLDARDGKGGGAALLSENGVAAAELEKCHQTKGIMSSCLKGGLS